MATKNQVDAVANHLISKMYYRGSDGKLKLKDNPSATKNGSDAIASFILKEIAQKPQKTPHDNALVYLSASREKIQDIKNKLDLLQEGCSVLKAKYWNNPHKNKRITESWQTFERIDRESFPILKSLISKMEHYSHEMAVYAHSTGEKAKDKFNRDYELFVNFCQKANTAIIGISQIVKNHS